MNSPTTSSTGSVRTLERRAGYDIWLLVAATAISMYGALFVLTSSAVHSWQFHLGQIGAIFWNHVARLGLGALVLVAMMFTDYRWLQRIARWAVIAAVLMLIAVLFVKQPHGATAHRWLTLFGISFQPAELTKFALIIYFAMRVSAQEQQSRHAARKLYQGYLMTVGVVLGLVMLEPNLSMAVLILGTAAVLLYLSGVRLKPFILPGLGAIVVFALVAWFTPYMHDRLSSYFAGILDPLQSSYHVKQSLIGIGQGGLAGVGLGASTQKHFFLPEPFKDFIFSIVGEEWGFVGATTLIGMYLLLISRAWRIARNAPDTFGYYVAAGITATLALSAVVNMGVTMGVLPATGQPLPLFSYGGSSLLMTLGAIGVLLNISRQSQSVGSRVA
ncbi:cell division protein FtsW [candidate division KSB1 bacterium]|nr:cell division protein FtsW [candidate division KSB1 bacterium]